MKVFRCCVVALTQFGGGGGSAAASMSPIQLDATVIAAEAHLLQAMLHLMDESKIGFIKCAMTVRSGWKLYQRCDEALGGAVTAVRGADGSLGMRGDLGGDAAAGESCAHIIMYFPVHVL